MNSRKGITSNRGFTLVELLVALVILSVGLLGVAGMQINSMKGNHNAFLRSQALQYANEVLDMMRANRTAATGGAYNIALGAAVPNPATTIAQQDIVEWRRGITGNTGGGATGNAASGLPGGDGSVVVASNAGAGENTWTVTIRVQWVEGRLADDTAPFVKVVTKL